MSTSLFFGAFCLLCLKTNQVVSDIYIQTSHIPNLLYLEKQVVSQMYNYLDEADDKITSYVSPSSSPLLRQSSLQQINQIRR